ncbi:MAG: 5,6-dimethylbenzimidazole synthase [Gammaproteobacteria bacterium]|nr:5,6-dimethylbenzimidazole synthase [Gammaproteobacteria bacterium]
MSNENKHRYSQAERHAISRVIAERRDVRHFCGGHVEPETLWHILDAAHHAPSVGFMQPWRFIRITDQSLRLQLHALVDAERLLTADSLNERSTEFMRLKIEGILDCAELLVVALTDQREKYILGRRTMPEMDLASASCAIQNMWLTARAEGLGMGWVSFFAPDKLGKLLNMPADSQAIAILCLGPVEQFDHKPLLETQGWDKRKKLQNLVFENSWCENTDNSD